MADLVEKFYIRQYDTKDLIKYALKDTTINLTGATTRFLMKNAADAVVIDQPAVILIAALTPTLGYVWTSGQLDNFGDFWAYFEVNFPSAPVFGSYPNYQELKIIVRKSFRVLPRA